MCQAAGIWGPAAAEVMSLGQSKEASEKQVLIQILFAGQGGEEGGDGGEGGEGGLAVGQAKGCWEIAEDAKQAPPPTLEAHIFVLRNLVCCQRPHFSSMA